MRNKIAVVGLATVLGVGVGALLGHALCKKLSPRAC
jgi:hypothetical protein